MKYGKKVWMNGRLVPFKNANVHVLTHALHYSTAVFEGIRCYDTPKDSAIFRLQEHIDRLFNSAKLYSMKMKYSKKQISNAIIKTVKASGLKECYIRPIAYCSVGAVGLTPPLDNVDVAIACWEWKLGESKAGKFSGAKCKISNWIRIDSRSQPMESKAAANYSNAALARVDALKSGYDEAIMLNYEGKIAEGSAENIFIVKDAQIKTPPLESGVLAGITRDSIIQIIKENGGYVVEIDLEKKDLFSAEEVFMTGTAAEVKSVTQIDKKRIGNGKPGNITQALQKSFKDVSMGNDHRFLSWLTYV